MSGLKPCPFCGGEAHVKEVVGACDTLYTVGCSDSGCMGYETWLLKPTEEEAIAAWNRRAERTCRMVHDHLTDTVFCDVCGERFDSVAQYMAMVPKGLSVTEYKPEYKDARYCPHCGAKVVGE